MFLLLLKASPYFEGKHLLIITEGFTLTRKVPKQRNNQFVSSSICPQVRNYHWRRLPQLAKSTAWNQTTNTLSSFFFYIQINYRSTYLYTYSFIVYIHKYYYFSFIKNYRYINIYRVNLSFFLLSYPSLKILIVYLRVHPDIYIFFV